MADPLDFETISAVRGFTGLKVEPVLAAEQEILDAVDKYYGEADKAETDAGRPGRRGRRGPRAPARHGQRSAGDPAGERDDRAGGGEARQRHPHRAVREGVPHPLPRGRRAVQPGAAAARAEGRHHLAREADGQAEHRRAPAAAGRPHQDQDAGARGRPARLDAADAVRRKRGDAPARPLGGRFLRPAASWASTTTCWRAWSTSPRCRTASSW